MSQRKIFNVLKETQH